MHAGAKQPVGFDFYPRPPGGGRRARRDGQHSAFRFLSTPSGWRATKNKLQTVERLIKFLSTPSGWRATIARARLASIDRISIHALRVEGDPSGYDRNGKFVIFLSTPSGWRATSAFCDPSRSQSAFLSTPSGWRATPDHNEFFMPLEKNFYPRPPGGGRQGASITSSTVSGFLSTPSGWRATRRKAGRN